ncbi:MAG: VTT domain-containing protein [Rothia sp. (in: high G+C Gram-positive bacteria)]|nr:VTT domain-containing protein [Rothia sp. (in: high G+C Gram-positive bacteria)]
MIGEERINKARNYFDKYGTRTVIIARFVPVVRTVVPVLAGINGMPRATFIKWNIIGAIAWGVSLPIAGHYLGEIAFIREHVDVIVLGIIAVSLIPVVLQVLAARRAAK